MATDTSNQVNIPSGFFNGNGPLLLAQAEPQPQAGGQAAPAANNNQPQAGGQAAPAANNNQPQAGGQAAPAANNNQPQIPNPPQALPVPANPQVAPINGAPRFDWQTMGAVDYSRAYDPQSPAFQRAFGDIYRVGQNTPLGERYRMANARLQHLLSLPPHARDREAIMIAQQLVAEEAAYLDMWHDANVKFINTTINIARKYSQLGRG